MTDARGVEGSTTGVDRGHKHGEGGNKTMHLVTVREEDYYHATNTKASENVSAILPLKSQLGFEQNDEICTLASCNCRSTCAHEPVESPIIRVSLGSVFFVQIHR